MAALMQSDMIDKLRSADLIFGSDETTGKLSIVFGNRLLERIVETGRSEWAAFEIVPIHQDTLELEALIEATTVAKGHHEYRAS